MTKTGRYYFSIVLWLLCMGAATSQPVSDSFKVIQQQIPSTQLAFKLVPIAGGSFTMGSADKEKGRQPDEGPAQKVTISPFWMGETEVTYDQYDAFFKDETITRNVTSDAITRPSPPYIDLTLGMGKQGGFPANSMSHYGALMYCRWLYNKTGIFYRLPTEAEWEYACRAGSAKAYPSGNDTVGLGAYAWYGQNSGNKYHKVAEKVPNKWGLYDMLGNVAEWTLDQYDKEYFHTIASTATNPLIPRTSRHPRTLKGGSFSSEAVDLRSAARLQSNLEWNKRDPQIPRSRWWNADAPFIGFRIVRPLNPPSTDEINKFFASYLDNY